MNETCHGGLHAWDWARTQREGRPLAGAPCLCGRSVVGVAEKEIDEAERVVGGPTGFCALCGRVIDDHTENLTRCPRTR